MRSQKFMEKMVNPVLENGAKILGEGKRFTPWGKAKELFN